MYGPPPCRSPLRTAISVFLVIIWRQKKGAGLAIGASVADNLIGIIDARRRNESPARVRRDEFVRVSHLALLNMYSCWSLLATVEAPTKSAPGMTNHQVLASQHLK